MTISMCVEPYNGMDMRMRRWLGLHARALTAGQLNIPASSATNNAHPIPTGAIKVPLCFSAASMKIVNTSRNVKNISRKRPLAMDVPPPSVVFTFIGPGRIAETTAAAQMAPSIWEMKTRPARSQVTAPIRAIPSVTYERVMLVNAVLR